MIHVAAATNAEVIDKLNSEFSLNLQNISDIVGANVEKPFPAGSGGWSVGSGGLHETGIFAVKKMGGTALTFKDSNSNDVSVFTRASWRPLPAPL